MLQQPNQTRHVTDHRGNEKTETHRLRRMFRSVLRDWVSDSENVKTLQAPDRWTIMTVLPKHPPAPLAYPR
jgi:hypothetical protein